MNHDVSVFAIRPKATDNELIAISEGLRVLWPSLPKRVHRKQDFQWRFSGRLNNGSRLGFSRNLPEN
jgi:hypothetical protein